ncbi:MAG TPA: NTP transferase domain-containing protein [Spirochaetota bacterium]|nr:NTP transferase domain-containing protein [Spirochaetota bacterium]HPF05941.1 NTP transferase domain-containing protein [Spirochaetota bacterium]HPR37215.1 NTP transferase domain-containing protein [Spirochaetota bacterium]HRX46419.1 NTP transferase domain-containing protein [Spirochaetota bacterium]
MVLAGGKGVRMQSELPKVLHPLCGKPLIEHVVENLNAAGINDILVVVGYKGDDVIQQLNGRVNFVWQHEQLGTGHAVMQAESYFKDYQGDIVVACGDVPLIKPETFKALVSEIEKPDCGAVVLTMVQDNPTGYGRIIYDSGSFSRIVEEKDATDEQKKITEVNSGTYIFNSRLLFEGLKKIDTNNAQREYYLPDALNFVLQSGYAVKTVVLKNPVEGRGINTRDELISLEKYVAKKTEDKSDE